MKINILNTINDPAKIKDLSPEELNILADEIRRVITEVVAKNGGHLAPNLGVVELTLGIHRALNAPRDKIIWDVGHQCYVHKLLTGRYNEFSTIRTYKGLSGFPKKSESEYDVADTGHASTSVGLALGVAEARDLNGDDFAVVAVMGDGSLTGGLAYEALNQAGHRKKDLIVILNDNEMSIDANVGAISAYLDRLRLDPGIKHIRDNFEEKIQKIPGIGKFLYQIGENMRESLKHLLVPGLWFEEMGFKYIGPIDGHDIEAVEQDIRLSKNIGGPVLIHAITKKGKGYEYAEDRPSIFHGIAPFDKVTGEISQNKDAAPSYTSVFGEAISEIANKNKKVVAITAAMSIGTGLEDFSKKFPERFYDVGIAEGHAVTFAAGLALGGLTPVVAIYSTFLQRAYDQIIHDVALQDLKVVFAIDRAGIVGEDGPTHHGVFDISYLRNIPKLVIMVPSDECELRNMLYTAVQCNQPVAIRYPRGCGEGIPKDEFSLMDIGKSRTLMHGRKVAFLAIGKPVYKALRAAEILSKEGYEVTVVDMRFAKPIDTEVIDSLALNHDHFITVEDNSKIGGFGSAVAQYLKESGINTGISIIGLPDKFLEHGSIETLYENIGLDPQSLAKTALLLLKGMNDNRLTEIELPTFKK